MSVYNYGMDQAGMNVIWQVEESYEEIDDTADLNMMCSDIREVDSVSTCLRINQICQQLLVMVILVDIRTMS